MVCKKYYSDLPFTLLWEAAEQLIQEFYFCLSKCEVIVKGLVYSLFILALLTFALQPAAEPSGEASNEITLAADSLGITTLLGHSVDGTFYPLYQNTCQRLGDTALLQLVSFSSTISFKGLSCLLQARPWARLFNFAAGQSVTQSPSKSTVSPLHIPGAEEALSPQYMGSQLLPQQKVRLHCHNIKSKTRQYKLHYAHSAQCA